MTSAGTTAGAARPLTVLVAVLAMASAFVLDRLSKNWALAELGDGQRIPLLPTVELRLVFNPGMAFSFGADAGPLLALGIAVLLLALTGWIAVQIRRGAPMSAVALLAAAAGGGVGNFYDRATRGMEGPLSGHVVDMIAVEWFAIFNVADIFTVCGLVGWVAISLIRGTPAPTSQPAETSHRD